MTQEYPSDAIQWGGVHGWMDIGYANALTLYRPRCVGTDCDGHRVGGWSYDQEKAWRLFRRHVMLKHPEEHPDVLERRPVRIGDAFEFSSTGRRVRVIAFSAVDQTAIVRRIGPTGQFSTARRAWVKVLPGGVGLVGYHRIESPSFADLHV